jgi:hypothetical protein
VICILDWQLSTISYKVIELSCYLVIEVLNYQVIGLSSFDISVSQVTRLSIYQVIRLLRNFRTYAYGTYYPMDSHYVSVSLVNNGENLLIFIKWNDAENVVWNTTKGTSFLPFVARKTSGDIWRTSTLVITLLWEMSVYSRWANGRPVPTLRPDTSPSHMAVCL